MNFLKKILRRVIYFVVDAADEYIYHKRRDQLNDRILEIYKHIKDDLESSLTKEILNITKLIKNDFIKDLSREIYASRSDCPPLDPISVVRRNACISSAKFIETHLSRAMLFLSADSFWDFIFSKIKTDGLYCEFGVYKGDSINYFGQKFPDKIIYGFDSFEGLPYDWTGTSLSRTAFDQGGHIPRVASNVRLIKGWFKNTLPEFKMQHKDETITFAFIDSDLYESTKDIFDNVGSMFASGSIIILDEYIGNPNWELHVHKALNEWSEDCKRSYHFIAFWDWKAAIMID